MGAEVVEDVEEAGVDLEEVDVVGVEVDLEEVDVVVDSVDVVVDSVEEEDMGADLDMADMAGAGVVGEDADGEAEDIMEITTITMALAVHHMLFLNIFVMTMMIAIFALIVIMA
jgi:hypothetical protein